MNILKGELINFAALVEKLKTASSIGLDVEGSSLDPFLATLLLIQISFKDEETFVINAGKTDDRIIKRLLEYIVDNEIVAIGHNIKYDMKMLYHNYNVLLLNVFDTMISEALTKPGISSRYASLESLMQKYCNITMKKDVRNTFIDKTDFNFTQEQLEYAAKDVEIIHKVAASQYNIISRHDMEEIWKLEHRLIPVIVKMEYQGIAFDSNKWMELARESEKKGRQFESETFKYLANHFDKITNNPQNALDAIDALYVTEDTEGGSLKAKFRRKKYEEITSREEIVSNVVPMINLASPKQAVNILQKLGVDTDSSSIKELQRFNDHPFVSLLLKFRNFYKRGHAFGEEFLRYINKVTGFIHTIYNQVGTVTGRSSSANPNLQNIPADPIYRSCFIARPDYYLNTADYSQIELRLMAERSGEPLMIQAFQDDVDLHALTASLIFDTPLDKVTKKQRRVGKTLNFAVIYGTTEYGLYYNFGWPLDEGKEYLERYFNKYKVLEEYLEKTGDIVIQQTWSSTTLGRKRFLQFPSNPDNMQSWEYVSKINKAKRQGINEIIQGDAAEILKLAMINFFYENPFGWEKMRPLLQVHDELVIETHESLVEYNEEEEKYQLIPEAAEYVDWAFKQPGEQFLHEVPIKYSSKVAKTWVK